jgi:hypothetical protein
LIGETESLTYEKFQELKDTLACDKEDPDIYYENAKAKAAGMKLRGL